MALIDNVWYVDGGAQPGATNVANTTGIVGATASSGNVTIPAGSLIIVAVTETGAASGGTLADVPGNIYSIAKTSAIPTAAGFATIFYVANCLALTAQAITYTKAVSGNFIAIQVSFVTGIATSTPLDATTTTAATGTGTAVSVTSGVPTQNGEFLFSCIANATNPTSFGSAPTGWVIPATLTNAVGGLLTGNDVTYGGLAPVTFTNTLIGSVGWAAFVVGFKIASIVGYGSISGWAASTTYVTGNLIRQSTPSAINGERVFVAVASTAGTGQSAATEPSWTVTRGAKTTDNTVTWQEATGIAALNGDLSTNTPAWSNASIKNAAITLGQVIQNVAGTLVLICTTAGTAGNGAEPSWAAFTNAGATTADNSVTWTTLGASFSSWAAPHARMVNAFASTWGQAGNSFFTASEHAETQFISAMTLTSPGTAASPCFVYCVNKSNVPPGSANLASGAIISTTGANAISFGSQHTYWAASAIPGINFQAGSSSSNANIAIPSSNPYFGSFKNCQFTLNNTGSTSTIRVGVSGGNGVRALFDGCNLTFGSQTAQSLSGAVTAGIAEFRNCTVSVGANVPTTFCTSAMPYTLFQGCDLSAFDSGKTLIGANATAAVTVISDCKIAALVTVAATPTSEQQRTYLIRGDSVGTNYRHEKYEYTATQTVETTIIRTAGASDGTTPISWKVVSTANSKWVLPFECIPMTVWCETTGSHTVTVYGTTTGGGVPNNDDIWITAEYLKDSGDPLGGFATTTKTDNLAASTTTNNSSDASTWGGGGAGNGFKMVTPSFTVNQKGPITIYVNVAKASTTYYVDPRPSISGITVSRSLILAPGMYANELGGGSGSFSYIN